MILILQTRNSKQSSILFRSALMLSYDKINIFVKKACRKVSLQYEQRTLVY